VLDSTEVSPKSFDAIPLHKSFQIQPGNYDIVVNVEDTASGNLGVVRDILNVESYETGLLQISDIITAYHIKLKDPLKPLNRQNIKLYHHPAHIFYPGQELHVYFEIYNLFNANTNGIYRYKLEYAVTSVSGNNFDKSRMRKIFANATVSNAKKEVRWISQNFNGFGSTDYQKILIQYAIKDPGEYMLTLRVTDLNSDLISQKSIPIWIIGSN
jgi:hypothetical protein